MKVKQKSIVISSVLLFVLILITLVVMAFFIKTTSKYNVYFFNNVKNEAVVVKAKYNDTIKDNLPETNIENYEFVGWYADKDYKQEINLEEKVQNIKNVYGLFAFVVRDKESLKNISSDYIKAEITETLSENDLKDLKNKKYLDLSSCKIENNSLLSQVFFNSKLEKIILPNNIIDIENEAFKNSYNLCEIKNVESVQRIGDEAFYNCSKLNNLNLKSIKYISDKAFEGLNCDIYLSKSLEQITSQTFYNFNGKIYLNSENQNFVFLNDILYSKDKSKLYRSFSMAKQINIDSQTKSIEPYAFYNQAIEKVSMSAVENIYAHAFESCKNLKSVEFGTSPLVLIDECAFKNTALNNVTLPKTLVGISASAFENSLISSVNLDQTNIVSLGKSSFKNCQNLTNITLPSTITQINEETFLACKNLEDVKIQSTDLIIKDRAFFDCFNLSDIKFTGDDVEICNYAFCNCYALSSIECFYDAKSVGIGAFKNCSSIFYAYFNNIEILNDETFYGCTRLRAVNFSGLIELKSNVFYGCEQIKNFNLPNTLTSFDETAFLNSGLESISSNSNNFYAENGVLYNNQKNAIICYPICKNNANFTIKEQILNINSIGFYLNEYLAAIEVDTNNSAFLSVNSVLYDKQKTTILKYPNAKNETGVTVSQCQNIGKFAFSGNLNIVNLVISDSVLTIGEGALSGMKSLKTLTVPFIGNNISSPEVLSYLFSSESSSNYMCLPSTLTEVEVTKQTILKENTFSGSNYLTKIVLDSVSEIRDYALSNMPNLTDILVKNKIESIGYRALSSLNKLESIFLYYSEDLTLEDEAIFNLSRNIVVRVYNENVSTSEKYRAELKDKFVKIYSLAGSWLYLEWVG